MTERGELEIYADQVADKVFIPLAEFDVWWLELIQGNEPYWAAEARRIVEKWTRPEEEEQVEIREYTPPHWKLVQK